MNSLQHDTGNEQEVWKSLEPLGYPGYEVSNLGRVGSYHVASPKRGTRRQSRRILNFNFTTTGYPQVKIVDINGKTRAWRVHSLVAEMFLGRRPEGMYVCHYDNCKTNNRADNLRYDTQRGNLADRKRFGTETIGERNGMSVLTEVQVIAIREAYAGGKSMRSVAKEYGVHRQEISDIVHGEAWRHVGGPVFPPVRRTWLELTFSQAAEIRIKYAAGGTSMRKLGQEYGVDPVTIFNVVHQRRWKSSP